jgi:hypothetical protein
MSENAAVARFGMPMNIAAGDDTGYNYSSARQDHEAFYGTLPPEHCPDKTPGVATSGNSTTPPPTFP